MGENRHTLGIGCLLLSATVLLGATATFTPVGPTIVEPGTGVTFDVTLSVSSIASFDAADVVIGASNAHSLVFTYSPEWDVAFANVTDPLAGVGFYSTDIFVGGNNPSAIGTSLRIGTVIVDTQRMPPGVYSVQINSTVDQGVSKLSRGDLRDPLNGSTTFTVLCAAMDSDCDGDVDLIDTGGLPSCLGGPGNSASSGCQGFDFDEDHDVDLRDWQMQMTRFTGS